ncbi:DUF4142 domain-containing protein [Pedobacter africanus]|uniref:DUF4142 domain-containing protein n=1 Tax=Pedobacter africanus TaxID=151894 RepID=A0A1W2CNH5_9SPHI|nr:DUF4142 domain-containing protein [Pedobacter africanus]SMC86751.1 protein of unknown function [Pedobacter africanus]
MKPFQLFTGLSLVICLFGSCVSRKPTRDAEQKRKPAITGVTPTIKNPSRGVINASGDGLTPGIGRSNGAGSEESATSIANSAIAKANVAVKISERKLSGLSDEELMGRISELQNGIVDMSGSILKSTGKEKIRNYAEAVLKEYGAAQSQLKKLLAAQAVRSQNSPKAGSAVAKSDFDYVQAMISGHQDLILLLTVAGASKDNGLKNFGTAYLPLAKKQLEDARELTKLVSPKQKN